MRTVNSITPLMRRASSPMSRGRALVAALACVVLTACGGTTVTGTVPPPASSPPPPITISISPTSASAAVRTGTVTLTATVANAKDPSVNWAVNGVVGGNSAVGTVASGVYHAPAVLPSPANVVVTAACVEDSTKSAAATIAIVAPVVISVTPPSATIQTGTSQQFTATVENTANTYVTWQVDGVTGGSTSSGTISTSGRYTAPSALPANATVTVTAISVADVTRSASSTVTLTATPQPISVSVSPPAPTVQAGIGRQQFAASVSNTTNTAVNWQVNGTSGGNSTIGTISTGGLYAAPASVPSQGNVTVIAVSAADATRSDSAIVTISASVAVRVSPTSMTVTAGGASQTFTAQVTNSANTAVTWKVNGVAGGSASTGTISTSGVYVPPATMPSQPTVTVTAVSAADPTRSASATVTIGAPVSVTISPTSTSVQAGLGSQQFTATVANAGNKAVTWKVNGIPGGNATVGTVSAAGLYTAPTAAPSPPTVTVTAVSDADPSRSASASATVTPAVTVSVSPASASVVAGSGSQQFTATVSNAGNTSVNWTVNGVADGNSIVGTISGAGLYSAPASVPSSPTVTVAATSVQNSAVSGTAHATIGNTTSISPQRVALTLSQSQQFTATVAGGGGINWSVDGVNGGNASVGTISPSGIYTPPASAGKHTFTVTASSASNSASTASASVAVTDLAGVFTYHSDSGRTGQNLKEYALTPTVLQSGAFGKRWSCPVDGDVYAQPLYVANLSINGGMHNVLFVATQHDSLYAIDADSPTCVTYWHTSFLSPGVTSVPAADTSCSDIPGEYGVTGTPVIDAAAHTIFLVAKTKESGGYFQRLHAIDLATGLERANSPTVIAAAVPTVGGGTSTFSPLWQNQRPGLALTGGGVFISWASHCDHGVYHGWVMRYEATTLAQTAVLNTTPNGVFGGIWMSGGAPAVDSTGSLFLTTGNGTYDNVNDTVPPAAPNNDFGQSFLKLDSATLNVQDFYTPSQWQAWSAADLDVGSSGVTVLPDGAGPAAHPNVIVGADKQGHFWMIDRSQMTRFSASSDNTVQYLKLPNTANCSEQCVFSTPAYWNGRLIIGSGIGPIMSFPLSSGLLASASSATSDVYQFPSPTPMVSASPGSNGIDINGIVWALDTSANGTGGYSTAAAGPAVLRAYDATNLATKLYSSGTLPADAAGTAVKFTLPVVANGHVYVGGRSSITVYGLAP